VPLNPKLRERIDFEVKTYPDLTLIPVTEGRQVLRAVSAEMDNLARPPPPLDRVEDHSIAVPGHRVGLRLYFPKRRLSPSPVVLYLHGGSWVFGDLDTQDSLCREIAARSRAVVVSVDYRRSPEEKFPVALEDCYAAACWVADSGTAHRFDLRPDRMAIAGDDAGGNMAGVLAVLTGYRRGPPFVGQVLICPFTAYVGETPSYKRNRTGFLFETSFMPWIWDQYLSSPRQGFDYRVALLKTPDLSHAPPALIITAEYDPLRDEAEEFAERLRVAGVPTQSTRYNGMIHSFLDYRGLVQEGWDALEEIAQALRRWLEIPPTTG
jgi:acetyl esterase